METIVDVDGQGLNLAILTGIADEEEGFGFIEAAGGAAPSPKQDPEKVGMKVTGAVKTGHIVFG
jgi:hypothetical protein